MHTMNGRLADKVAIVSGGSLGLGAASVRALAFAGARVVLTARRAAAGEALVAELLAAGAQARFMMQDVAAEADWMRVIDATLAAYGRVDVVLNNAGTAETAPIAEQSLDTFRRQHLINLHGTFYGV